MARHVNSYIRHVANLGNKNALERVASYLVFLYETHQKRNLRLDMLALTQHDIHVSADYELLREFNIRTVRDGTSWPLIERGGKFDFSSLVPMLEAARQHDMQVIWNVLHYGCPDDLDVFSPGFVDRFTRYCTALARFIHNYTDRVPFYTPINEISFLSWAAGRAARS